MTRVSLKEAYDNKDVVAQIYAIRDIAEGAEDTANNAVSTANTASEHVDVLVPQVEGAVQNANNASASAQASAQTVAGYENRLSTVESETAGLDSDLNAVTLRVTTAEGQIVTIEGRVTALETADGQNVKIDRINDYAVGLTGNQTVNSDKSFGYTTRKLISSNKSSTGSFWVKVATWKTPLGLRYECVMRVISSYYRDINYIGILVFGAWDITNFSHFDLYSQDDFSAKFKLTYDGAEIALWFQNDTGSLGRNFIITVESEFNAGYNKANVATPIPHGDQVIVENPDWNQYTKVENCVYRGGLA